MILLKPCPFCHGKARIFNAISGKFCYRAECSVCFATTRYFRTPELAADAWNLRERHHNSEHRV